MFGAEHRPLAGQVIMMVERTRITTTSSVVSVLGGAAGTRSCRAKKSALPAATSWLAARACLHIVLRCDCCHQRKHSPHGNKVVNLLLVRSR